MSSSTRKTAPVTRADLDALERATAEGFAIVAGLLAEATTPLTIALHLCAAREAATARRADPLRDRLLQEAYRLVLLKAHHAQPDHPTLQTLYASEFGGLPVKH